jgi:16S rRNA (guanine(966)-N(2))-methyltransferase RsmD
MDSVWWDAFGGTGAVGIEAISRGAAYVRFTELNRLPINTIKANLTETGFISQAEVKQIDAFALFASICDMRFHYIYIAPPQFNELWSKALHALDENPDWLTDDAWAIIQIAPKEYKKLVFRNLEEFDQRKYGSTLLTFYRRSQILVRIPYINKS